MHCDSCAKLVEENRRLIAENERLRNAPSDATTEREFCEKDPKCYRAIGHSGECWTLNPAATVAEEVKR